MALLNLGNALVRRGDHEQAARRFRRLLEVNPDSAMGHGNYGFLSLYHLGDAEAAATHYRRAAEIRPGHASYYTHLGIALGQLGEAEAALESHEKALELEPAAARRMRNLAWVLVTAEFEDLWDVERAEELARRAVRVEAREAENWLTLGIVLLRAGAYEEAVQSLSRSDDLDANARDPALAFGLAIAHYEMDSLEEAATWFSTGQRWVEEAGRESGGSAALASGGGGAPGRRRPDHALTRQRSVQRGDSDASWTGLGPS